MMTMTLAKLEADFGLTYDEHLDREAEIPTVKDAPAPQGDVMIRPVAGLDPATTAVPAEGVAVVRGENGGNTHLLVGKAFFDFREEGLVIGVATVPNGATALLSHPEHGGFLIAPGSYEIRRQREQKDEIELVRD